MTSSIGLYCLVLAVWVAAGTMVCAIGAVRLKTARLYRLTRLGVGLTGMLFTVSLFVLVRALLRDEFALAYVADNSERSMGAIYKVTALWAGQEGSMLLWAWLVAVMGSVWVFFHRKTNQPHLAAAMGTIAAVLAFFAVLLLFASSPFATYNTAPVDGQGMNPLLQNPGMIAHPPLLFAGYAGFTIPFALLIGRLISGDLSDPWIVATRHWLVASWALLGVGIILGMQWAYVELGWGGYWAWDPVENASLLPWLAATATIHSIILEEKRGMGRYWNALLIVLTFLLPFFGAYLTRSGVLQDVSVHSFPVSPIGYYFLAFLGLSIAVFAVLLVLRFKALRSQRSLAGLVNKESAFLAANILLLLILLMTLAGTTLPVITKYFADQQTTVNIAFYNLAVIPLILLLMAMMAAGPLLKYGKSTRAQRVGAWLVLAVAVQLIVVTGAAVLAGSEKWPDLANRLAGQVNFKLLWSLICGQIVVLAIGAFCVGLVDEWKTAKVSLLRLLDMNHRRYGGQLSHLGAILIVLGIAGSSLYKHEENVTVHPGQTQTLTNGYRLAFGGIHEQQGPNFHTWKAHIDLFDPAAHKITLHPEKRIYNKTPNKAYGEVALRTHLLKDTYITLEGFTEDYQTATLHVQFNPLVLWLWIGGIVLTLGALIALLPRLLWQSQAVPTIETAAVGLSADRSVETLSSADR